MGTWYRQRLNGLLIVITAVFTLVNGSPAEAAQSDETGEGAVEAIERNVLQGVDWVQRRRTFTMNGIPYGVTGMPIVFYSLNSGFHYGGWLEVADYSSRPYRYRVNFQWWLSTGGKRDHHIRVEIPGLLSERFAFRFLTQDRKDIGANFFGTGNDTRIEQGEIDQEPDYYVYHLEQQRTSLDFETNITGPLVFFAGARFNRGLPSRVQESKGDAYFVFNNGFVGLDAGWSNFLAAGFIFDTRDDQELTTSGFLSEFSAQKSFSWLGTDYEFTRLTLIHTHYLPMRLPIDRGRYVWVNRVLCEELSGSVPFYELTEIGGSIRSFKIGGVASFRGYESRRFADKRKLIITSEMRRFFRPFRVRGQYIQTQAILFCDFGRVATDFCDLFSSTYHYGAGAGVQATWNSQLTLRFDAAFSPEGHRMYLEFGDMF